MKEPTNQTLDLFTAETVMGFEKVAYSKLARNGQCAVFEGQIFCFYEGGQHRWTPTDSRAQALMVLERCANLACVSVSERNHIGKNKEWFVYAPEYSRRITSAAAPTLPLAICRFAHQLWKGVK